MRAGNANAIRAPIGPFHVAVPKQIPGLFADSGEVRFGRTAVAGNESGREAMRALVWEIGGKLLLQNRGHTAVR